MDTEFWIAMFWFAVLCLVALGIGWWLSAMSCNSRWSDYGQTKYELNAGCMVHYKGKWTPATAIREI